MIHEFNMVQGILSADAEKSKKRSGNVPYPAVNSQRDICGAVTGKSANAQANFSARNDCDENMEPLISISANINANIEEQEMPNVGSGITDIFFNSDDLVSNGFTFNGREFTKLSENGKFVEYIATFGTKDVFDICGKKVGIKFRMGLQRSKRDDNCAIYTAAMTMITGTFGIQWSGATSDSTALQTLVSAVRETSNKTKVLTSLEGLLLAEAGNIDNAGQVLSDNVKDLVGTTITLGGS